MALVGDYWPHLPEAREETAAVSTSAVPQAHPRCAATARATRGIRSPYSRTAVSSAILLRKAASKTLSTISYESLRAWGRRLFCTRPHCSSCRSATLAAGASYACVATRHARSTQPSEVYIDERDAVAAVPRFAAVAANRERLWEATQDAIGSPSWEWLDEQPATHS